MKVELDLTSDQLRYLDNSLTELVKNLTEEQQITILNNYMQTQMNTLMIEQDKSYYSSSVKYSKLGEEIIDKLQGKVAEAITDKILATENIKKIIDIYTEKAINNIPSAISEGIAKYITDQIFLNKDKIMDLIMNENYNIRNEMYSALNHR